MAAKRYKQAVELTKPALMAMAVKRSIRQGFEADYFLVEAWFGNKSTIRLTEATSLTAILRMKKGKMKYRYTEVNAGKKQEHLLTAVELFQKAVRKQWDTLPSTRYQAKTFKVERNLAQKKSEPDQWITVRLQYVRGVDQVSKSSAGKHDWALFLCTDPSLSPQKILEIYALC